MTMTPQELQAQEPTLELLNSEIASRMARQSDSGAKVDTKAVFLVGFAAAAAQFLVSRSFEPVTGIAALLAYAVAIAFGISIFHLADYEDIEPREVLESYARSSRGAALMALAATRVQMFEQNGTLHKRKAGRWAVSLAAVAAGICLSCVAVLLHTGDHDRPTGPGKPTSSPTSSFTSAASQSH
ncbi:hypothetical protein BX265_8339 [Streptomyces sp. TLI_235]|nr:hypothetical protein [Streptomyces sp. TLI_235]PBC66278.1 hypothetical protein BX265_8339 [Streptomyces sp. TLI_235]